MTRRERLLTPSAAGCCVCDSPLTVQELDEFYSVADDPVCGEPYCRRCLEAHLHLCRECSARYTADRNALCGECAMVDAR